MRKCPECAEEIQDEALRCRFCGHDLRPSIPAFPGMMFSHSGQRYLLGAVVNRGGKPVYLTIWDRSGNGVLPDKFKPNQRGWDEAYAKFAELEPDHWRLSIPKCPTCGSESIERISGGEKVAAAAFVGVFSLGHLSKTFRCLSCRARW